jgi:hypothetical protein
LRFHDGARQAGILSWNPDMGGEYALYVMSKSGKMPAEIELFRIPRS